MLSCAKKENPTRREITKVESTRTSLRDSVDLSKVAIARITRKEEKILENVFLRTLKQEKSFWTRKWSSIGSKVVTKNSVSNSNTIIV